MKHDTNNIITILTGSTASGKSALALKWAKDVGGCIINADSMQVYKGLSIITAQPTPVEQSTLPHYLYGMQDPLEGISVARWLESALGAIQHAQTQGQRIFIVGGTGLYIRTLLTGISPIPSVLDDIRAATADRWQNLGAQEFTQQNLAIDSVLASRFPPTDRQRQSRIWEVYQSSGKPLSYWQSLAPIPPLPDTNFRLCLLWPEDKSALLARARARFEQMVENGAIEEVQALKNRNLPADLPAMKALGVPEICSYLDGKYTLAEATEKATISTNQYIKRQFTWMRGYRDLEDNPRVHVEVIEG